MIKSPLRAGNGECENRFNKTRIKHFHNGIVNVKTMKLAIQIHKFLYVQYKPEDQRSACHQFQYKDVSNAAEAQLPGQ